MGISPEPTRAIHIGNAIIYCKKAEINPDDCCIEAALANWTLCNMYAGCRGIEWMQTNSTNTHLHSHHKNRFGNAYAFTLEDVQCKNKTNQLLTITEALAVPNDVGSVACTTLYAMGFQGMEIKHLLRWKSDTFMTYLRNLTVTLRRHNEAVSDASCIPNFLKTPHHVW